MPGELATIVALANQLDWLSTKMSGKQTEGIGRQHLAYDCSIVALHTKKLHGYPKQFIRNRELTHTPVRLEPTLGHQFFIIYFDRHQLLPTPSSELAG